jgi:hypothetical protein
MRQSDVSKAEQYIRERLVSGPQLFRDLLEGTRISKWSLQRASQNLKISRTRDGKNGPWRWALPPEPEYLSAPEPEVEAKVIAEPVAEPAAAPALILSESLSGPPDVDALIAAAQECGLQFPLSVTRHSPSGQTHISIYTDARTFEVFLDRFSPDGSETRVSIKRWNAMLQRPYPPALTWDHGNLVWQESRVPPAGFWRDDPNFRRRRSNA